MFERLKDCTGVLVFNISYTHALLSPSENEFDVAYLIIKNYCILLHLFGYLSHTMSIFINVCAI